MRMDCTLGLGYLPIIWTVFSLLAFAVSYTVSVLEGHVYYLLPSVSDTGTQIPEANIFSFLMNISIIVGLSNYFTRYFQCQHQARQCGDYRELIFKCNHISLLLSLTSVLGALIVANVQSRKEYYLLHIHDVGAVVLIVFTALYLWVQTYISYKTAIFGLTSPHVCHFRFLLVLLLSVSACTYFVTSVISFQMYAEVRYHTVAHWMPGDGGYLIHVLSNASEWLSVVFMMSFVLTYFEEFQQVILIIDCQEKSPTIISYNGIGEYSPVKMNIDSGDEDNNN